MADINKVAALCIRDKRLLVVRSKGESVFFALGGKIEPGETELECLEREVKEEVNCGVKNPAHFRTFEGNAHTPGKIIRMSCYTCELEGAIASNAEVEEARWIDRDYKEKQIKVAGLLELQVIPELIKHGLL